MDQEPEVERTGLISNEHANIHVKVKLLSRVRLFVTPWTAAHQTPPSMGFSRQEYWSGVPLPSPVRTKKRFCREDGTKEDQALFL